MTTPAGWYEDPEDPSAQRYWDGQEWTPHRKRDLASRTTQPQTPQSATPAPPPAAQQAPPPTGAQPPAAPRGKLGVSKVAFVLAGLGLVLAVAALVAGRVELGSFLPGIGLVAAIGVIAAFFTLRSQRSVPGKAVLVITTVLVVAAAIPASTKVAYPAYDHFFGQKSAQASPAGPAAPSAPRSPGKGGGKPAPGKGGGKPSPAPSVVKSGILVETHSTSSDKTIYGFLDPISGKYSEVASFNTAKYPAGGRIQGRVGVSPDFTKVAVIGQVAGQGKNSAGWIDTSGTFTSVSPKTDTGAFGGSPPDFRSVGFDEAGNFYYIKWDSTGMETYKLAAGSTTNAEKISSETPTNLGGALDYDGSMHVGCNPVNWLGPDNAVTANGSQITTHAITGRDDKGCPISAYGTMPKSLLPKGNIATVTDAVGNHDGTKVAFKYYGPDSGGASQQANASLYIVAADGGEPVKVELSGVTGEELHNMTFLKWI